MAQSNGGILVFTHILERGGRLREAPKMWPASMKAQEKQHEECPSHG